MVNWFKEFYSHCWDVLLVNFIMATFGVYGFEVFHEWKHLGAIVIIIWLFTSLLSWYFFQKERGFNNIYALQNLRDYLLKVAVVVAFECGAIYFWSQNNTPWWITSLAIIIIGLIFWPMLTLVLLAISNILGLGTL